MLCLQILKTKNSEGSRSETGKRARGEVDSYRSYENQKEYSAATGSKSNKSVKESISKAFELHENEGKSNYRCSKRVKTSEKGEHGITYKDENVEVEEKPCSESTAATLGSKTKQLDNNENNLRKLSISNFEPIQSKFAKSKTPAPKDNTAYYGTPQPNRTESLIKHGTFVS